MEDFSKIKHNHAPLLRKLIPNPPYAMEMLRVTAIYLKKLTEIEDKVIAELQAELEGKK